jgi:hypothetical protein
VVKLVLLVFVSVNVDGDPHEVPVQVPANLEASSVAELSLLFVQPDKATIAVRAKKQVARIPEFLFC